MSQILINGNFTSRQEWLLAFNYRKFFFIASLGPNDVDIVKVLETSDVD